VPSPIVAVLAQHEPLATKRLLRPFVRLISISRDACGGDADKFMILLTVAIRTTEHPEFECLTPERIASAEAPPRLPCLGLNMRSIAESMAMPRETTRRKVTELVNAGWLARDGASVQLTAKGYQELAPVRQGMRTLAASYWELVSELLSGGP
jgi:hypothetical protein